MSELTIFIKPNGTKIKVSDRSVDKAISLGWKKANAKEAAEKANASNKANQAAE